MIAVVAFAAWLPLPAATSAIPDAPDAPGAPQQRRGRVGGGEGMYRARVTPHWFAANTRFWYRNDLAGGTREFILVDAVRGRREPAFDHAAVAKQLSAGADAARLPVEELEFSADGANVLLRGRTHSWRLDFKSGKLAAVTNEVASGGGEGLAAEGRARPSMRNGPETDIIFENRLDREVEVFWLDDEGSRQSYGKIAPLGWKAQHTFSGHVWLVADERGETLAVFEAADRPDRAVIGGGTRSGPRERRSQRAPQRAEDSTRSPDGKWTALLKEQNVHLTAENGDEVRLSEDGKEGNAYERVEWSPDSRTLVAWRVEPGERKAVHLVRSSPSGGGRAQLESRPYALPGDKFPRHEINLFDTTSRRQLKPPVDRFEHEWESPQLHWYRDGEHFAWQQVDRGHQRLRVIEVDCASGAVRNVVDEKTDTFIWTAHTDDLLLTYVNWLEHSNEILYVSERDGWRHLYLVDVKGAPVSDPAQVSRTAKGAGPEAGAPLKQITRGEWVVRGIDRIDEEQRQVWFRASGRNAGQDPYLMHFYRVNFDGSGLVALTEGNGNHSLEYSPDGKFYIDTWSRVDAPPVNELRRAADGRLVCKLEEADISELKARGWESPEVFSAKGRDGKTDIWGIICRPRDFDPGKKYPVIEQIYAGPQGSFVPKTFSATPRFGALTDAGFIVVQIDGMGTANRSKAFHDVCWKNLKDGGFPDRIRWHQAVAAKYPYYDVSRVGIYGTSAGGQNAGGAVLFHPEFYKAAVANSGCHDNRMDKASWNEQWMGYPVGPQYAECSNIENAARLQGHLFLVVGEMDNNVPPESTMRYVDALVRAKKDFDLLVIPNGGHGAGGDYYQRRMTDFFTRHLRGVVPAHRNFEAVTPSGN
jgi:dipeptidyl-peptidase 4